MLSETFCLGVFVAKKLIATKAQRLREKEFRRNSTFIENHLRTQYDAEGIAQINHYRSVMPSASIHIA